MTIANEFHFLFVVEFRFPLVNMCWVFSLSSMISKSHFSFYLLLFLSLFPFQAKKYLVFAIQAFSLVDFSLSFCSFPSNQSPDESESPNRRIETNGFIRPFGQQWVRNLFTRPKRVK